MELLRRKELISLLNVSESTLDRMVKAGRFPEPLRIGERTVAWPRDDVQAWIEARRAARDTDAKAG